MIDIARELAIYGDGSYFMADETKRDLGELMANLLYHELDEAMSFLLSLDGGSRKLLLEASQKLQKLCEIC